LQFWPRKRSKRAYPRIRNVPQQKECRPLGFLGYKVGMTHIQIIENRKTSPSKGEIVTLPVTIIECPPMRIAGVRLYKKTIDGSVVSKEFWTATPGKDLGRKVSLQKKKEEVKFDGIDLADVTDIRPIVYTQPRLTTIGKKKPELFEMYLGGSVAEKLNFVKENWDKEILIQNIFKEGEYTDLLGVSKGKGFQGTTKRFGTSIRPRKSEKHKRGAGNLGPWNPAKVLFSVPQPGRMGYHQRIQYNKQILKISHNPADVNQKGGFHKYGVVRNPVVIIKGSVVGSKKRAVLIRKPIRQKDSNVEAPVIEYISTLSKQGR
jgi:large subunit ribosomal protein L3